MKSSTTSAHRLSILIVLLLLFVTSATQLSNPTLPETSSRNPHHHHHQSCDFLIHKNSRSLCVQLQRMQHYRPLPVASTPPRHEIDPRYGVEKRLVPSGPNPLHN